MKTLMDRLPIQARAFPQWEASAQWLDVPLEIVKLEDEPMEDNSGL